MHTLEMRTNQRLPDCHQTFQVVLGHLSGYQLCMLFHPTRHHSHQCTSQRLPHSTHHHHHLRQRARCSSTLGRRADHSVVSQRCRTEGADRHRLQDLSGPCSEPVAEAMAWAGRLCHEAAGAIKNKPEADRAVHRTCAYGWRSCAVWLRRRGWRQNTCRS